LSPRETIGVDLGGTKMLVGVVDDGQHVHYEGTESSIGLSEDEIVEDLARELKEAKDARPDVLAGGLGIPATIDHERGVAVHAVNLEITDVPIRDLMEKRLGLPVFVKPSRAGSSHGITKVTDWAQLDEAVAIARRIDPKVLVEAAIIGREIECGVLEGEAGGTPESSLLAEIHVDDNDWYDFETKYIQGSRYSLPADLPAEVTSQVQEYARRTFTALDCAGLARVDFFVTADHQVY